MVIWVFRQLKAWLGPSVTARELIYNPPGQTDCAQCRPGQCGTLGRPCIGVDWLWATTWLPLIAQAAEIIQIHFRTTKNLLPQDCQNL